MPPRSTPMTPSLDHAGAPYRSTLADDRPDDQPEYTVYRSRPRFLSRRRDDSSDARAAAGAAARRAAPEAPQPVPPPAAGRRAAAITPGRVASVPRRSALARLAARLGVLFLVSAQIQSSKIDDAADERARRRRLPAHLAEHDPRPRLGRAHEGNAEPGAQTIGAPSRSDSILLLRVGGGANAKLSIPRDTVVDIPGHGREQDQRRLRDRRPRAGDRDGRAVPRHRRQPPRRGQLRELPGAHRRARRHRLHRAAASSRTSTAAPRTAATRCA